MNSSRRDIKIILADSHELFRDGFNSLILQCPGITLVAEALNGEYLVRLTAKHMPDVVLTEVIMPVMDGIEASKLISKKFPQIGIIALSMFNEIYFLKQMIAAGAKGYLKKNADKKEIISAIETVSTNNDYYCRDTTPKLAKLRSAISCSSSGNELSCKEKQIITLICRGFMNKEIAKEIFQSVRTIEGCRERIMEKTQTKNPATLALYAIANKIIYLDDDGLAQPFNKGFLNPGTYFFPSLFLSIFSISL